MNAEIIREIAVDFYGQKYVSINSKQYEQASRFLAITCLNEGRVQYIDSEGYCAFVRYSNINGYNSFSKCKITTDGKILIELSDDILSYIGICNMEIVIVDGSYDTVEELLELDERYFKAVITVYLNIKDDMDDELYDESSMLNDLLIRMTEDYSYVLDACKSSESNLVEYISTVREFGFKYMGTISFAELSSIENYPGYIYVIDNDFVSDTKFLNSGASYEAGTIVYCTSKIIDNNSNPIKYYLDCFDCRMGISKSDIATKKETLDYIEFGNDYDFDTVTPEELIDYLENPPVYHYYVSLGDSIAAGHTINEDWEKDYGTGSQYGNNGNILTEIVPGSYTDLIKNKLVESYGEEYVTAVSFAHSGDTNEDLRNKLDQTAIVEAISRATITTVCIGANTILGQVGTGMLSDFIAYGDPALKELDTKLEVGFNLLASDEDTRGSYKNIFKRLLEINGNPNAKFVFTNIYNPYKYLWLDETNDNMNYENGYFSPVLTTVPNIEANIPGIGEIDIRKFVYEYEFSGASMKLLTERINRPSSDYSLSQWVETKLNRLNSILATSISEFNDDRIMLADTKLLYESTPDNEIAANKHYSDLVNVEIVRGETIADLDWAQFWNNFSISDISSINSIAENIVSTMVNKVIVPDVDPHPEEYGQYVLYRSFADALGWQDLIHNYINFDENGGIGSMRTQEVIGTGDTTSFAVLNTNTFTNPNEGYRFVGWNTKPDGSGTAYSNGQVIGVTSDITLYAQWNNYYTITFRHSSDAVQFDSSQTGPMECYALWIDGVEQSDLGAFSNSSRTYSLPYGTNIGVIAQTKSGSGRSYITMNGTKVAETSNDARYTFALTGHTDIHFEWNQWFEVSLTPEISYWNCYITTN